jgi:flavin-dependent dehydrogenase
VQAISREFDLIVAGAGPAGSAAAITAARMGARVLLLEQGHFPRQKVCGEFVSAESLEILRQLLVHVESGLDLVKSAPRIERARMFIQGSIVEIPVQPSASIPRFLMDEALWRAAQAVGVVCCDGVTVESVKRGRVFEVLTSAGSYFGTLVIAATGRWSKLRQPVPKKNAKKLIGLKAHYRESNPELSTDLYFFSGGYCGVQPVDANTINVCSLVRADVATQLDEILEKHPALAERARPWTRVTDPVSTSPLIYAQPEPERDGVLFAGDTAGFIDPFAGDGISLALRTGTAAAHVAMHVIAGRVSADEAARNYRRRYAKQFFPAFRAAAHARRVIACPRPLPRVALQFLRVPWIARGVFARTRGLNAA